MIYLSFILISVVCMTVHAAEGPPASHDTRRNAKREARKKEMQETNSIYLEDKKRDNRPRSLESLVIINNVVKFLNEEAERKEDKELSPRHQRVIMATHQKLQALNNAQVSVSQGEHTNNET